ncbi:MAG: flavodoxin [Desulfotomaculum sp.]|nr:flavodoxin [Desulfotomaculum sp.]MCL0081087.1 flavodoxin [Peptococcaceae bacterium]
MGKAILIYGSTTGNTEQVADVVSKGLSSASWDVTVKNVAEVDMGEIADYELVVLGCPTWGDGELEESFIEFHANMDEATFKDKKVAVFGPGDSELYPDTFCVAVTMLESKLNECGAKLVAEGLMIDGDVGAAADEAESWAADITK